MNTLRFAAASLVWWSLVVAFSPAPAMAQDDKAVEFYQQGLAEMEDSNYTEAAALFVQAWTLDPDPVLAFNAGRAYENNGDVDNARVYYQKALDSNPPEEVRQACESSLERLKNAEEQLRKKLEAARPKTITLSVAANTPSEVWIDGEMKGQTPLNNVSLVPGKHTVVVRRSGYREYTEAVAGAAGDQVAIFADMQEVPLLNWVGWSGLGLAIVGGGVAASGLVFENRARDSYDEAQGIEAQRNPEVFDQLRDDGESDTFTARVLYGSGITMAIVGTGLFVADLLVEPGQEEVAPPEGGAQLWLGPAGEAGVRLTW
ncbi:MAG: PEGA domain-containing protein [Myxococcota bacterium]